MHVLRILNINRYAIKETKNLINRLRSSFAYTVHCIPIFR
ncbi:MAG: hypothetical protein RLZZ599_18, partial [Bacteroidota bacterium]